MTRAKEHTFWGMHINITEKIGDRDEIEIFGSNRSIWIISWLKGNYTII